MKFSKHFSALFLGLLVLVSCDSTPQASEEVEPLFEPVKISEYRFLDMSFTGDLMAHKPTFEMADFSQIYAGLGAVLLEDDLSFVNLETPADATRPYETYPTFNVQPDFVRAAILAGADVFSLANNHTNDQGSGGIRETAKTMAALAAELAAEQTAAVESPAATESPAGRDIWYSGIRLEDEPKWEMTSISFSDWKLGFVAITDFMNSGLAKNLVYLVDHAKPKDQKEFLEFLATEKRSGRYDFIVVSFHGGFEYVTQAPRRIAEFLARVSEAGADIVWGNHPHVMQPWQVNYLPTGRASRVVISSLGNFISGQTWFLSASDWGLARAYTGDSAVLSIQARKNLRTGQVDFSIPQPLWISTFTFLGGTRIGQLSQLKSTAPDAWRAYYSKRLEAMQQLTQGLDVFPAQLFTAEVGLRAPGPARALFYP